MQARRIPLFPLNVVLFPGMALPLHIFEPRYQEMIRRCLEEDRLFGVCLIRAGTEVGGPAAPYSVGCTCEILSFSEVGEGRLLLTTLGRERFRIRRLHQERAYLEADVEPYPEDGAAELGDLSRRVGAEARRYIELLLALNGEVVGEVRLPEEPTLLSFLVGAVLQVPLPVRQELLEVAGTAERLRRQVDLLEQENERLAREVSETKDEIRPFRFRPEDLGQN